MPHVFVESNWLFAYAAPAHHQVPAAVELIERARLGAFTLHMPNVCFGEVRQPIMTKCQPRKEADAIRRFLSWSESAGRVARTDAEATRVVLDQYESSVRRDLARLDSTLRHLAGLSYLKIFGLDEDMLALATQLALDGVAAKPFDHAILASVLVQSTRLWEAGEREISFCETDADLQPWDRYGNVKRPLADAFDNAHVWVYGDFMLEQPQRHEDFA